MKKRDSDALVGEDGSQTQRPGGSRESSSSACRPALNLALERMSATQLDVLPVISRANIHELEGTTDIPSPTGPFRTA